MSDIQFDYMKFKDAVHLIAHRCAEDDLGRVKFHKALYFADMLRYVASGNAMTGEAYRRQPRGPMATHLGRALSDLQSEGKLEVSQTQYFGFWKDVFRAKREPDTSRFTADELQLLDDVIEFVCRENSARSISEVSHTAAWDAVGDGEIMPYRQAFLMFDSDDYDEADKWAASEENAIAAGSVRWLDSEAIRDFRSRLLSKSR